MPRPFTPKVATANHLLEGDVIYFARPGWTRHLAQAAVAQTPEAAEALQTAAEAEGRLAVGLALVGVDLCEGRAAPAHFREAFRARGPSNYFHGKQADDV